MPEFFIPGVKGNRQRIDDAYDKLRASIELELGGAPGADRIFKLWSRRGSIDCVTEVAREDPVHGGTVIAIFDMGPHWPFVVYRQQPPGTRDGARDVLACSAYIVSEFDRRARVKSSSCRLRSTTTAIAPPCYEQSSIDGAWAGTLDCRSSSGNSRAPSSACAPRASARSDEARTEEGASRCVQPDGYAATQPARSPQSTTPAPRSNQ